METSSTKHEELSSSDTKDEVLEADNKKQHKHHHHHHDHKSHENVKKVEEVHEEKETKKKSRLREDEEKNTDAGAGSKVNNLGNYYLEEI